ncbi:hypothetical protein CspHIS471_0400640 [Cutaneotrichosporon sp. HIS471]|nr:hypothetical protein CspHIS471_0400640 [Cutaneotrichosporon sp. HIS471]
MRRLSAASVREASSYTLGYAIASLLNKWNDREYELGERCGARLTLRQADLRGLNIGVGGLPYPDTRVQAAFRTQSLLHPQSAARSPRDKASDYGQPFDARYDWSDPVSPARASEGWGIHQPERVLTARCACWRHEAALAALAVEGFAPRRLTRASLKVWEEDERWRALARLLGADVEDDEPTLLTREEIIERICTCPTDVGGILDAAELGACRLHENNPNPNTTPYAPYARLSAEWVAALTAAPFTVDIPHCALPPANLRPPPAPTQEDLDPTAALTLEEVAAVRAADASPRLGWSPTSHMGSAHGHSRTSSAWTFSFGQNFLAPPPSPRQIQWGDLAPSEEKLAAAARHLLALDENATAARALVRAIAFAASTAEAGQGRVAVAVAGTRMARCVAIDLNVVAIELAPEADMWCDSPASSVLLADGEDDMMMSGARNSPFQQDQKRQQTLPTPKSTRSSRSMHDYGFPTHFASHVDLRTLLAGDVWERVPHDLGSFPCWPFPNHPSQEEAQTALLTDDCLSINEMYTVRTSAAASAANNLPRSVPIAIVPVPTVSAASGPEVPLLSQERLPHTPEFASVGNSAFDGIADLELPDPIIPEPGPTGVQQPHFVDAGLLTPPIDFPEPIIAPEPAASGLSFFPPISPNPEGESTLGIAVPQPRQSVLDKLHFGLHTPDSPVGSTLVFRTTGPPPTPNIHTPRLCRTTPGTPRHATGSASVFGGPPSAPRSGRISLPPTPDMGLGNTLPEVELPFAKGCSSSGLDWESCSSQLHSQPPSRAPTPPKWQIPPRSLPIWPPPSAPPSLPPSPALPPSAPSLIPPVCTHTTCVRAIAERVEPDPNSLQRLYDALVAGIYALGDRPRTECLATAPVGAPRGPLADEVRSIAKAVRRDRRARNAAQAKAEAAAMALFEPVVTSRKRSASGAMKDMFPPTPISSRSPPSPSRFASLSRWWKGPPEVTAIPTAPPTRTASSSTLAPPQLVPPCVTPESAHMVALDQAKIVDELLWILGKPADTRKLKSSLIRFPQHQQGSQVDLPSIADSVLNQSPEEVPEEVAEYEPVLAALEQAHIVVIGVHPALMDILVREVAGASV